MATENLTSWLKLAGPAEIEAGRRWYREAHAVSHALAEKHGTSVETAAGVLAAISPEVHWHDNVRIAEIVMSAYKRGATPADVAAMTGVTCYGANIDKAFRVMSDPAFGRPESVCDGTRTGKRGGTIKCSPKRHGCLAPVHGPKVAAFYHAILGAPDGAVDVWATRAYDVGPAECDTLAADDPRRAGAPGNRHAEITAAYATAGAAFDLAGHEAQAVVWVTIRAMWRRADGARNGIRKDDLPF